jgi:hypothetical protein
MTLEQDAAFQRFVQRRQRLNEQLEEARLRIDAWIAEHQDDSPSTSELAYLEGILKARRDLLAELVELDDTFMTHILELLGRMEGRPPK